MSVEVTSLPYPKKNLFIKQCGYWLFVLEVLLGVAHLIWPDYTWGQGRKSYFNFGGSLTLASWLASVQLMAVAIFSFCAFHSRSRNEQEKHFVRWIWIIGGLITLVLSIAALTRFPYRLEGLAIRDSDIYRQLVSYSMLGSLLILFAWFLIRELNNTAGIVRYVIAWIVTWSAALFLLFVSNIEMDLIKRAGDYFTLFQGMSFLLGCTFLFLAVGSYVLGSNSNVYTAFERSAELDVFSQSPNNARWLWLGVAGMTFTMIFLQILLFRILTIFGDYLTAHSIIAIALLGIAIGGLIGALCSSYRPISVIIVASFVLPFTILLAFGASVSLTNSTLVVSILLMLPFAACSTVITIVLANTKSHVVYFVDLLGAGLGALLVNSALVNFREEGSVLVLVAVAFLLTLCFIFVQPFHRYKYALAITALMGALGFTFLAENNLQSEWLNIARTKIQKRYPEAEILFSRSSFVGRYDVVRRKPDHKSVATFNNGRIIDNMRRRPVDDYQIDPRIPHTLIDDPVILILGLSGDGVSKTARFLGKKVYGVEINPVVVELQTNELLEYNHNSYKDIEVEVMDGRSYVEQSDKLYDMITLMNAHSARGRTAGRAPSPEYLNTHEAIDTYLSHLTDRGVLIIEEPVSTIRREVPVWKLTLTMRDALIARGIDNPAQHFFIFQWKTKRNNYVQIVMKKVPFTAKNIGHLRQWLDDVDNIRKIAKKHGKRMGPIRTKTTILHSPDEKLNSNFARILRGEVSPEFLQARNLVTTTDDRPFHFDVEPNHTNIKDAYRITLVILAIFLPLLLSFLYRYRDDMKSALPYVFVVAMTGLGYLLVELILIQRYTIFLGTPVVTFTTVLGTLLFFSGLGSLWSGRLGARGLYLATAVTIALLAIHQWLLPIWFPVAASFDHNLKIVTAIIAIAPLGFFMGVPFPYVLRTGKQRFTQSTAAFLFAVNAAASALAVPLSLNFSMSYGFSNTFLIAIGLYIVIALVVVGLHSRRFQFIANTLGAATLSLLLISPLFSGGFNFENEQLQSKYRVYALNYGRSLFPENKVIKGGDKSTPVKFAWMYWLIKGNGRTILVDTGFSSSKTAKEWKISHYKKPHKLLKKLDIDPTEVTDVILTHAHWDHMGGLKPYDNATVWIQEKEYQHAMAKLSESHSRSKGMRWRDFKRLLQIEEEGRLRRIDGDYQLVDGVTMTLGGAHTPGFQYVSVDTLDGSVIIAGDATYLYENNTWHKPIGTAVDYQANLEAIREMHRKAASPFLIIPGHDPAVRRKFPKVDSNIVQITAVNEL